MTNEEIWRETLEDIAKRLTVAFMAKFDLSQQEALERVKLVMLDVAIAIAPALDQLELSLNQEDIRALVSDALNQQGILEKHSAGLALPTKH